MATLKTFRTVHSEYKRHAELWRRARALYASPILCDGETLESVFPSHHGETGEVYEERKNRAFYENYAGGIVDKITANVFQQRVRIKAEDNPDQDFYDEFEKDATAPSETPGSEARSIQDLAREWLTEAQLTRCAWMQVCLPMGPESDEAGEMTLADEDAAGARRAWLTIQPAESVVNWRFDSDGRLVWLVHCREEDTRDSFDSDPMLRRVIYTVWTDIAWTEYVFEWNERDKKFSELPDDTEPTAVRDGGHTFGAVPWVCMELPLGLWTMGKIESIARELFNKHCALSWAEYRNLFPILASFTGPEEALNPATADPDRGRNQRVSPGYVWQGGDKDRLEFVAPPAEPYHFTLEHLRHLRDEMHRVVHQMAQSVDNSGAALQRSGMSKAQDRVAESIISNEFGAKVRQGLLRVYALVAAARQEEADWEAEGLQDYDAEDTATMVAEAAEVEAVGIPSATFQRLYKGRLARRLLGEDITPEDAEAIDQELEGAITPEQFDTPTPREQFDAEKQKPELPEEDEGSFA